MKRLYILLFFLSLFTVAYPQFDTAFAKSNIRKCADSLAIGFKTKDWELFARYSYPALIGALGGKEEFKTYMAMMFAPVADSAWKMYEPGNILQVIKTEGDLQAVIELKSVLEWQGARITTVSHLIGESWDGGMFWTFFDPEGDRPKTMLIKPDLSDQIIIPLKKETTEPVSTVPKTKN
ncbi:MAG: hypothetical protein HZB42_10235 [Sphingobacteriales bacterium]|nr:hypothetical protein [Sphingobacteriales bacterium]